MDIRIRGHRLHPTASLRQHIERRFGAAMDRFSESVGRVTITLLDTNGPKGGIDKQCRVAIQMRPKGYVVQQTTADDLYHAIDRAADRAGHTVTRYLDRRADHRRSGRGRSVADGLGRGLQGWERSRCSGRSPNGHEGRTVHRRRRRPGAGGWQQAPEQWPAVALRG